MSSMVVFGYYIIDPSSISMMFMFSEDENENEKAVVSDDALGEVLEEEPEDDEIDPLMAEEEEGKEWA